MEANAGRIDLRLSSPERSRLVHLEGVIRAGIETFIEVGLALAEIRDGRLYRESYPSFEAYCEAVWDFTGRRARQLIAGAAVGTIVPVANEAQARALAGLEVAEIVRAYDAAVEMYGTQPTARELRVAVEQAVRRAARRNEPPVFKITDPEDMVLEHECPRCGFKFD